MHKAGSYTVGRGSVSCDARIRNRRGIAVARTPSASIFRPIRPASSDCRLLTVSAKGRLPFFAPFFAMPVDTDIYDFLSSFYTIGKNAGIGKDSAGSDYRYRRQIPYITFVLETRSSEKREINETGRTQKGIRRRNNA